MDYNKRFDILNKIFNPGEYFVIDINPNILQKVSAIEFKTNLHDIYKDARLVDPDDFYKYKKSLNGYFGLWYNYELENGNNVEIEMWAYYEFEQNKDNVFNPYIKKDLYISSNYPSKIPSQFTWNDCNIGKNVDNINDPSYLINKLAEYYCCNWELFMEYHDEFPGEKHYKFGLNEKREIQELPQRSKHTIYVYSDDESDFEE